MPPFDKFLTNVKNEEWKSMRFGFKVNFLEHVISKTLLKENADYLFGT